MSRDGYSIALIVEGDGEIGAVPNLVSRWFDEQGVHDFHAQRQVICSHSSDMIKKDIEHFIGLAVANRPDAILIIVDADNKDKGDENKQGRLDCPKYLGPELLARAKAACPNIPVGVVLAYKEYEAWFLHILPELQAAGIIPFATAIPSFNSDEETHRGCKERLEKIMGRKYKERRDQLDLTRHLPTSGPIADEMKSRSRSYRHLLDTLDQLALDARNKEA